MNNGCAGDPTCVNAPPPLEVSEKKEPVRSDEVQCPICGSKNDKKAKFCYVCHTVFDPASRQRAPDALASLIWGILGLFFFGIILGFVAIRKSANARELIETDPTYTGMGMAQAGQVLGWLDVVLSAMVIIYMFLRTL
jgi:hypothetical protein